MLALGVLAAGCGGGGSGGSGDASSDAHYDLGTVKSCLRAKVDNIVSTEAEASAISHTLGSDAVADSAGEGWLVAGFNGSPYTLWKNVVQIIFERNADDAGRTLKDEQEFAYDAASVTQDGNAIIRWNKTPTSAEQAAVGNCLEQARSVG